METSLKFALGFTLTAFATLFLGLLVMIGRASGTMATADNQA